VCACVENILLRSPKKSAIKVIDFGSACFPESDTRVLTSQGFLFLDQIESLNEQYERGERPEQLLYACYDAVSESLVYRPGTLVFPRKVPEFLVDITADTTRSFWEADADAYGRDGCGSSSQSSHASIRVTPDHLVYMQAATRCDDTTSSRAKHGVERPFRTIPARELAPGFVCDCPVSSRTGAGRAVAACVECLHAHSLDASIRLLAHARQGVQPSSPMSIDRSSVVTDAELPVHQLGLHGPGELDAFLELFGYWLGNGTLLYSPARIHTPSVLIPSIKDVHHLKRLAMAAGLVQGRDFSVRARSKDGTKLLAITRCEWGRFFDDEHSIKNDGGRRRRQPHLPKPSNGAPSEHKCLPSWAMTRLTMAQSRALVKGLTRLGAADGMADNHSSKEIFTSSVSFREQLLQLLLHAGYSACFSVHTMPGDANMWKSVHPKSHRLFSTAEKDALLAKQLGRRFRPAVTPDDVIWRVSYSDDASFTKPVIDVVDIRHDGTAAKKLPSGTDRGEAAEAVKDGVAAPYRRSKDGRIWCVQVEHEDHLIVAQRAHREKGVVTKAGQPLVIGNCFAHAKVHTYIQSRFYRAPEVILSLNYNAAIDMWSLGCICFELCAGTPLFDGADEHDQMLRQVQLLGMPPAHLLEKSKKANKFFTKITSNGSSNGSNAIAAGGWQLRDPYSTSYPASTSPAAASTWLRMTHGAARQQGPMDPRANLRERLRSKFDPAAPVWHAFIDLLLEMLAWDPKVRIKPAHALNHPFFTEMRKMSDTNVTAVPPAQPTPAQPAVAGPSAEQAASLQQAAAMLVPALGAVAAGLGVPAVAPAPVVQQVPLWASNGDAHQMSPPSVVPQQSAVVLPHPPPAAAPLILPAAVLPAPAADVQMVDTAAEGLASTQGAALAPAAGTCSFDALAASPTRSPAVAAAAVPAASTERQVMPMEEDEASGPPVGKSARTSAAHTTPTRKRQTTRHVSPTSPAVEPHTPQTRSLAKQQLQQQRSVPVSAAHLFHTPRSSPRTRQAAAAMDDEVSALELPPPSYQSPLTRSLRSMTGGGAVAPPPPAPMAMSTPRSTRQGSGQRATGAAMLARSMPSQNESALSLLPPASTRGGTRRFSEIHDSSHAHVPPSGLPQSPGLHSMVTRKRYLDALSSPEHLPMPGSTSSSSSSSSWAASQERALASDPLALALDPTEEHGCTPVPALSHRMPAHLHAARRRGGGGGMATRRTHAGASAAAVHISPDAGDRARRELRSSRRAAAAHAAEAPKADDEQMDDAGAATADEDDEAPVVVRRRSRGRSLEHDGEDGAGGKAGAAAAPASRRVSSRKRSNL